MRLCIYQKFPLYPVKRQFPILSQNNYSMIVGQQTDDYVVSLLVQETMFSGLSTPGNNDCRC